ncbi:hypothetical protein [Lentzea sp. NPDC092896]|uniref:hypothetical protein n=1 Tax=Lentzea sp. NPDC092896 TaxID=3364127 RepID=UPI003820BD44
MVSNVEMMSRAQMTALVDEGRGQRHRVAEAVLIEGRWWAVRVDDDVYRPVSQETGAELDSMQTLMIASEEKVARARSALSP